MTQEKILQGVIKRIRVLTVKYGRNLKMSGFDVLEAIEPLQSLKARLERSLGYFDV